jgi:molybdenum cofactor biosynthesis enzyme MoaA
MSETCNTGSVNTGFCEKCHKVVPVERVQRDNHLYLCRECPTCGHTETLISRDAKAYYEKREMMGYDVDAKKTCMLNCVDCNHGVPPSYVVLDVTNRCNMNCPICLANIPAMGFEFHPPIEYFEKIFDYVAKLKPRPRIQFFGGEPTCRNDLVDIMDRARKRGIPIRIVTNGLRFADEEYCKSVLGKGPQLMLGLDGLKPDIQKHLRKNPGSLKKKLKAIENIEKHSRSKITIMCTTAVGTSEKLLPDLIQFCYDKRKLVMRIMLIPLQSTAGPEQIGLESSTIEDVEHLMADCFSGLEFVPVGALRQMDNVMKVLGVDVVMGGAHPNCECLAMMVGDPTVGAYRPLADYLKVSWKTLVKDLMAWDKEIGPKLDKGILGRLFGKGGKKAHVFMALFRLSFRYLDYKKLLGPKPMSIVCRIIWEKIKIKTGKKWGRLIQTYTRANSVLQVVILPYEEPGCLESARLKDCPVSFACEHPITGEVDLVPFCSYFVYKNDILRRSAERWGVGDRPMEPANGDDSDANDDLEPVAADAEKTAPEKS